MLPRFNKFYSPEDGVGTGGSDNTDPNAGLDTLELLNVEDPVETPEVLELDPTPKPAPKEGEEEEQEEEVIDELAEIEKELKPPTDEEIDDELVTPARRRDILAKYPKLFKDFPYLEKAYYREAAFTELYPTIQDARISHEKAKVLDDTERLVMSGDISSVLFAAKQENGEAFNKIADNYLQTLRNVDETAYFHVMGNVLKNTIITMVREAGNLGEQGTPLKAAANILNQFVFGSQTFQPPTQLAKKVDPTQQGKEQELLQQKQNQLYDRFETVRSDLQGKADNVLKATIDGHIDPNGAMSAYVKQHATEDALKNVDKLIRQDTRFMSLLDKLWEKAFQSNFNKTDTDRIRSAYLSKAKTLLPSVIKTARQTALKDGSARSTRKSEDEVIDLPTQRGPVTPGRSTSPSSGRVSKASDIPKGMSTYEFLSKD